MKNLFEEQFMEEWGAEAEHSASLKRKSLPEECFREDWTVSPPSVGLGEPTDVPEGAGRIHSFESMGLADGPGIRSVLFFQGCGLRCRYCHNPDTWKASGGQWMTPEAVMAQLLRFKGYYDRSGGGITCSGGEPLLQPGFLIELLEQCRQNGIHTAVDTAGAGIGRYEEILALADLVILDIKHWTPEAYRQLTGRDIEGVLPFHEALRASEVPVWIRHVMVPGLTDSAAHMEALASLIRTFPIVQNIEILPYHTLGVEKYEVLNRPYWLEGVEPMDRHRAAELERFLREKAGSS